MNKQSHGLIEDKPSKDDFILNENYKTNYKAIKIYDSQKQFRDRILKDFENRNVGFVPVPEKFIFHTDGQVFVYKFL